MNDDDDSTAEEEESCKRTRAFVRRTHLRITTNNAIEGGGGRCGNIGGIDAYHEMRAVEYYNGEALL